MIEEEFKELLNSLETVGHYVPTVSDMFRHIRDQKNLLYVDPEDPQSWKGYVLVRTKEDFDPAYSPSSSPEKRIMFSLDLDLFPGGGRYEDAIGKILEAIGTAGGTHYVELAAHFGLRLIPGSETYRERSFVITLPPEETKKQSDIYQKLVHGKS